jgi:phosphoserine phosphatase
VNRSLEPVIDWARRTGIQTFLVSASPKLIVEVAAKPWQFTPQQILASEAVLDGERITPRMLGRVPYAEDKCLARERLFQSAEWLASFGDSGFDANMMRAARLGVAVSPKPSLRRLLPGSPFVELLS